jgi:hypothetical protein
MTKEQFIERYRDWTDEKLLQTFEKRYDYQPEAVAAMMVVMKERGLTKKANQFVDEQKTLEEIAKESQSQGKRIKQAEYEKHVLKTDADALIYAQQMRQPNGIYYQKNFANFSEAIYMLLWIGGVLLLMCAIVNFISHNSWFPMAGVFFISLTVASWGYLFYSYFGSTATVLLSEKSNKEIRFEVRSRKFNYDAKAPFSYQVGHAIGEVRGRMGKITYPVLYLFITNENAESVTLSETLTALQEPPPTWPLILPGEFASKGPVLTSKFFNRPRLLSLTKTLEGLNMAKSAQKSI